MLSNHYILMLYRAPYFLFVEPYTLICAVEHFLTSFIEDYKARKHKLVMKKQTLNKLHVQLITANGALRRPREYDECCVNRNVSSLRILKTQFRSLRYI